MAPSLLDTSATRADMPKKQQNNVKTNASGVDVAVMPPASESDTELLGRQGTTLAEKYGWPRANARGYSILDQHFAARRQMRIVHIGAGASGICFSKIAKNSLKDATWVCYDKNDDVGGTWLENRYPGCACDIPSANYQFTWARNPDWSQFYSSSLEIWRYMKDVAESHDLMRYMKLSHEVVGARWDEEAGKWHVAVKNTKTGEEFTDICDVLLNGSGVLNKWDWPKIEGLHSFKGKLMHSAAYEEGYSLDGKRVAVVGIGSSGVQIIATIAESVEKLYCWIRSPTWITAGFAQKFAGPDGGNFEYTDDQKAEFRRNPQSLLKYCKGIENELNQRFKFILQGTPEAASAKEYAIQEMSMKLAGKKELIDAIVPKDFGVGCRRPTPGNGFLEALTRDNVDTFTEQMQRVTEKGFVDHNGVEHEGKSRFNTVHSKKLQRMATPAFVLPVAHPNVVDVILCATGFDTSWVPRFPIIANGINLQDMWSSKLESYLSIGAPHMPNYWMTGGPYGPLGHGSFLPMAELLMNNFVQCIQKLQRERIKSLTPKQSMAAAFHEHANLFLQRTAWAGSCSSWFKQAKTDGPAMWPGSRLSYIGILETPRFEDYEIEYMNKLNPYEFLGNGFTLREMTGGDLSYYLGVLDEGRQALDSQI